MSKLDVQAARIEKSTPVTVLTGFLGSGKTTLLNRILAHADMKDTAVLINEFGEIGLDHLMVEKIDDDVVVLASGCICCTVQGELVDALRGLYMRRLTGEIPNFRRLVIETTGLADPAPIVGVLARDIMFKSTYRLDGIVTTVDGEHGAGQLDDHEEAVKQAAVADRIVLTKTDLADADALAELTRRLGALNPAAPIIRAVFGDVDPGALFDCGVFDADAKLTDLRRWLDDGALAAGGPEHGHDHGHEHGHDHGHGKPNNDDDDDDDDDHNHDHPVDVSRHDDHIRTFALTSEVPVEWSAFRDRLARLLREKGPQLLRIKGILNLASDPEKPLVVQCVQHALYAPLILPAWPDADRRSRVVFITKDLDRADIEDALAGVIET